MWLSTEEQLKKLTFQFVKLYERWVEDRQLFDKHLTSHAEMLKQFGEQIEHFEALAPQVKQQLVSSIQREAKSIAEQVGTNVSDAATKEIDKTVRRLGEVVTSTATTLSQYKAEVKSNLLLTIGITVGTTIAASLLIVWLLTPKPTIPLTPDALSTYVDGLFIDKVWPKLPRKLQKQINDISVREFNVGSPLAVQATNNDDNGDPSADNSSS